MQKHCLKIICGLIILFSTSACKKEGDRVNWNVDALLPLVELNLGINNLIEDSLLVYDENEPVRISFSDTIVRFSLDTLIQLPDTMLVDSFYFQFGIPSGVAPGTEVEAIEDDIEIQANDIELKKATLKEGSITVLLENSFQGPVLCTYNIPDATLNGVPLQISELIPAGSVGSPETFQLTIDVSNYTLDFSNGDEPFNHLPTSLTVTAPPGPPLPVSPGDGVKITTTFEGLTPSYAEGYFGQSVIETDSEVHEINAFDIIQSGSIDLDQVDVTLRLLNGFGIDVRTNLLYFNAINYSSANNVGLNHPIIEQAINLNRASHPNGFPVPSVYEVNLNEANSNIDEMIENFPDAFEVAAELQVNPLGNISNHHDFVYAESTIEGILDIDIPLCLVANNLTLKDTVEFSLGDSETTDNINHGRLIIKVNNGFPIEGNITIVALGTELTPTTILPSGFFAHALTDGSNNVVAPVYSELIVELDQEKIETLRNTNELVITAALSTSNISQPIKIFQTNQLDLKVVADFNYHVNK